jgi:hypothetical protein
MSIDTFLGGLNQQRQPAPAPAAAVPAPAPAPAPAPTSAAAAGAPPISANPPQPASQSWFRKDPQTGEWGVSFPGAQTAHNIIDRFTNNVLLGAADPITAKVQDLSNPNVPLGQALNPTVSGTGLPALRAQREQMNQQMGPGARLGADVAAQFSPTGQVLNRVPYLGPALQGAGQAGITAYNEGKDWPTIGQDTALGLLTGVGSQAASQAVRPSVVRNVAGYGLETAPGAVLGTHLGGLEHGLIGAALGPMTPLHKVGEAIRGLWPDADWTSARKAFQNLLMGTGSSAIEQRDQNQFGP